MTDSAVWWVENTNIDGFRHDASEAHPPRCFGEYTQKVRQAATACFKSARHTAHGVDSQLPLKWHVGCSV